MNLIDAYVIEVIDVREFEAKEEWSLLPEDVLYDKKYVEYTVKYVDMGGKGKTKLIYEIEGAPKVKKDFHFLH